MANPTSPPRLSPAELRRRLMAPPTDAAPPPAAIEEIVAPAPRPSARRDSNRYATQMAIDLDALMQESSATSSPRLTPLPESRLDTAHFRTMPELQLPPAAPVMPRIPVPANPNDELAYLRQQNGELTRIIEEMRPLIEEATAAEAATQSKEKQFEDMLAEKDLILEQVQLRVKELEDQIANAPAPKVPKTRDELEDWNDELEKENSKLTQERRKLEDDRRQLREDEESLEKQMREMECSMARERALMARQETELKRLSAEIQHELELLQRGDGTLREQLSKFQRRHQEVIGRAIGGTPATATATAVALPEPPGGAAAPMKKDSGLFGRIFRGNKS